MDIGDIVKLKSGGPAMTVMETARDGKVTCGWFNRRADEFELKTGEFASEALETREE